MSRFLILLSFLSLTCCRSTYDDVPEGNYLSKPCSFVVEKDRLIIMNRNDIGAGGDGVYYKPQHYNISLPRKIISVSSSNSSNFINYGNGQIIMVDADYKSQEFKRGVWKNIIDKDKVIHFIEDFYSIRNKRFDYDHEKAKQKSYSLYYDGQTYILFYNIKKMSEFDEEQILKSFQYIE